MKKILSISEIIEEEKNADHIQDKEKMTFNQKYLKSKKQPMSTDDGLVNKSITDVKNSLKEEQKCPEGKAWCPIHKKCIPNEQRPGRGKHFGQGKGPMGIPKQEQKIDDLVDEVFEEGFDKLSQMITIEKRVDEALDKVEPEDKKGVVKVRVSPTMQGGLDVRIAENEIYLKEDKNYKAYFKIKLLKSGYKSIKDMPDNVKKKFFNSVDKGWKAQNESITAAVGFGVLGGMAGISANRVICNKRFPTEKIRRLQKVAYGKCINNPFRKSAKEVKEPKQCPALREKIKTYRAFTSKCAFKYKGSPEKIKNCQTEMRRAKASLVAKKKSLGCLL